MSFLHATVQVLLKSPKFIGRDYLIEKLPKWILRSVHEEVHVKTRFGFDILVDPSYDKNIEQIIYERGVYEQATTEFVPTMEKQKTGRLEVVEVVS